MLDLLKPIFTNIWYVALIGLFFGGSIFVHELGHFLAARRRGLKVDRFSIGFGPKIFAWTRHGVEYRLSWIPLGGYVALPQLADMRGIEGDPNTDGTPLPPISYTDKMIVAVMGAVFNLIFAFLLACVLWVIKQPERADQTTTTIGYVLKTLEVKGPDGGMQIVPSPAFEAGLQVGDRVVAIDGRTLDDWEDLSHAIAMGGERTEDGRRRSDFTVERGGSTLSVTVHPLLYGEESMRHVGIAPDYDVIVDLVPPGSLADQIGLRAGDVLVSVAGTAIRNEQTYDRLFDQSTTTPLDLVVRRGADTVALTIPPRTGTTIGGVIPDSPAARAGLKANDQLLTLNGEPITGASSFAERIRRLATVPVTLDVVREGQPLVVTIPPRTSGDGRIGAMLGYALGEQLTIADTMVRINPVTQFKRHVANTFRTLKSLVDPRTDIGLSKMSGPVGIIRIYYHAVRAEIRFVLWLTILVNINLAIFNLLPIPVLDGGHMLFATIAKLRGRALPPNLLVTTQSVFMVLLLTMVVYVSFFDVRRTVRDVTRANAAPAPAAAPDAPAAP